MKTKHLMVKTAVMTLVLGASLVTVTYAHSGKRVRQHFIYSPQERDTIQQALEKNDYNAWASVIGNSKIGKAINESNFEKLSEAYKLSIEGNHEKAKEITDELGIKSKFLNKAVQFSTTKQEAVFKALENENFEDWQKAVGDNPILEKVTKENFPKLVEAHKLAQEGNFDEAKKIREEIGVIKTEKKDKGFRSEEKLENIKNALINNDYNAWLEAMDGHGRLLEIITPENFTKLSQAFNLSQEGKHAEARTIRQELGLRL